MDAIGRPSVGTLSFFLALRGTEVTAGTGMRACPSPIVSVLRHGQVSVKDPSAAPWTPPPGLVAFVAHGPFHVYGLCKRRILASASQHYFYGAFQLG